MQPTEREQLLGKAAALDALADRLGGRAAALLRPAAEHVRHAAAVYELDPTLERDPAGRTRSLDLIAETARQLLPLIRNATSGRDDPRWPIEQRWAEAEALAGRIPEHLAAARVLARPDHASIDGSQEISRLWLVSAAGRIDDAASSLRAALAKALSLPHPHPAALELAALADQITARADMLHNEPGVYD